MNKFKSFAFAIISASLITACSNNVEQEIANEPAQVLYEHAQSYLQDENYTTAIEYLQAIKSRYSLTPYSEQAQLDLIYAYYQSQEYEKLFVAVNNFIKNNQHSPNLDYALYMMGLGHSMLNNNFTLDLFHLDPANRDSDAMKKAFANFRILVTTFPNSPYTPDALNRMAYIKSILARHELHVAKFYAKRHAYVAVSNRIVDMLKKYPNTRATFEALPLLKKSYQEMGLTKLAEQTEQLIQANKGKIPAEIAKPGEPQRYMPPERS